MTQVRAVELQPGMTVRSLLGERCTVARVDNHGFLVTVHYTDGTRESARPDALLDLLPDGLTRAAKERAVAAMTDRVAEAAADNANSGGCHFPELDNLLRWRKAALLRLAMTRTVD